jgi:ribosomal protein L21E
MKTRKTTFAHSALAFALLSISMIVSAAIAADNIKLKDGISFVQDTDNGFPIVGDNMDDATITQGMPSLIFFGAAGDLNTNRQAKRLVDLYKKIQDKVKVIVIDVDHPASAAVVKLIKTYYKGYIPLNVILDKNGKVSTTHTGEIDSGELKSKLDRVM